MYYLMFDTTTGFVTGRGKATGMETLTTGQVSCSQQVYENYTSYMVLNGKQLVSGTVASNVYQAQVVKLAELARTAIKYEYISVTITTSGGVTATFPNGATFQHIALGELVLSTSLPSGFVWEDINGNMVPFVYSDLQLLASTMRNQFLSTWQLHSQYKAKVLAATTVSEIEAIIWN